MQHRSLKRHTTKLNNDDDDELIEQNHEKTYSTGRYVRNTQLA